MALVGRVNCPGSEPSGTVVQLSWGLGVRMGLRVILVFVSTFLLLDCLSFSGCVRALADKPTNPACVTEGAMTKCTCTTDEPNKTDLTATLCQAKNILQIACKQEKQQCAPEELSENLVCPSSTTILKDCKNEKAGVTPFNINTLLSGSSPSVSWQLCADGLPACTTKKLEIPPENFPFVDRKFMVGCVKKGDTNDTMKVTVTLEARASATEDHIVKCAYGKNSNPAHQTVTLTPEKNSFTLACGDQGDILPTNYKKEYCVSESGNEASDSCTGAYEGIFANYEATWWTKTTGTNEYKFTIPGGQFPQEEQKVTVGCQKKTTAEPAPQSKEGGEKDSSVCSVDVTIVASAASSAALTSGRVVMLATIVGMVSTYLL
ncbi:SRS domain-containing protein [Neospora caninum Liverpool]|uniref:SRS domain-containing protein n=1 Tax=Neospora caninum (strain Liverpool) TaxID=572307 RepID=F0VIU7_NEOCL|nr:SRS domain-containing protein [Neospora caninum Liverpool]CBZ53658.1 SRS domain-containing protein [Neospora caninum Liverpool]CEL67649.1 TPA: SRS domain-containing protein [Neospora caninum Liverpool]|eukprot:XP_003883690.1 SRS domain-containing protein [Neospora caninum Liverpool]